MGRIFKKGFLPLVLAAVLGALAGAVVPGPASAEIGQWTELAPMPQPNSEFGAAELDGKIYTAGGFERQRYQLFLIYDVESGTWSEGPELPLGTHHAGLVALAGKIYVVGGEETDDKLQIYDPATGEWSQGAGMLQPRSSMATVVLNGRIHTIGGGPDINVGTAWNDHEVYDPATDSWQSRAPLPVAAEHILGAAIGDKIYVAGGRQGFNNRAHLQIYDATTDSWTAGAPMPNRRSGHAVEALKGRLYVFGGEDILGRDVLTEAERYDPGTDAWESLTDVPVPVHGVASAVANNKIYLLGGARFAGSGTGTDDLYRFDLPTRRPAKPTNLRASRIRKKRLRLTWDDNSDNEDTFVIQRKGPGDRKFQTVAEVGADVARTTMKGLDPGTSYKFRVRARDGNKKSKFSNRVEVTTRR